MNRNQSSFSLLLACKIVQPLWMTLLELSKGVLRLFKMYIVNIRKTTKKVLKNSMNNKSRNEIKWNHKKHPRKIREGRKRGKKKGNKE